MRAPLLSFSRVKPVIAAAGVAAVCLAAFTPTGALASQATSPAKKHATINTYKDYDQSVGQFGCPNTTTYGETITVPKHKTKLTDFKYYMGGQAAAGQSMVVRAEVYAWDGTKATGSAIFESQPRTIAFTDSAYHFVSFKTPGATVTPGQQYVLFLSIDKDYESCTGNYGLVWGAADGTAYTGGEFVYQNNSGDEDNWTTVAWDTISSIDAVTKIYLS